MSYSPRSPRVTRGAIIGFDLFNPVASVVVFQYNPDLVTRTLEPQFSNQQGARAEVLRLAGAPVEKIDLDIEIDATDQLETGDGVATGLGVYPQLSALEMLLYPKSGLVIANTIAMAIGTIEVIPPEAPFTLLIWGAKRVVPIKLNQFKIAEEAHDVNLNPVRAKVTLQLQVLSYNDLPVTHAGYSVFLAHQIVKETMAVVGSMGSIANLGSVI
ncbi:MAG: hypothetical protein OEW08_01235 [Gammaproteobacteria bacterium]|nr:hypothetical protein [Gammaproteobacteria bacterium]